MRVVGKLAWVWSMCVNKVWTCIIDSSPNFYFFNKSKHSLSGINSNPFKNLRAVYRQKEEKDHVPGMLLLNMVETPACAHCDLHAPQHDIKLLLSERPLHTMINSSSLSSMLSLRAEIMSVVHNQQGFIPHCGLEFVQCFLWTKNLEKWCRSLKEILTEGMWCIPYCKQGT